MTAPLADNPFAVLTLIAAPAVFTNASSVLALGTGNRLARVVDRTRQLSRELHANPVGSEEISLWGAHLDRLQRRGVLLVRAMSFFYAAIGAFAGASLVSILGATVAASEFRLPFELIAGVSFVAGTVGFTGLVVGCFLLVRETRLALRSAIEEAKMARRWLK